MRNLQVTDLGFTDYGAAWDLQRKLFALRASGGVSDLLLLTEHNHVYTMGKGTDESHLLADEAELRSGGAEIYRIDRGGDITYHGPGQLVGYPIIDLTGHYQDIHRYLREIEEVLIRTLKDFGIKGAREDNYTGVWVGSEKIAAIGVKVSRWITMHGFALNVATNLSYYDRIIPCGIFHKGVTSMKKILGNEVSLSDVINSVSMHFGEIFGLHAITVEKDSLFSTINHPSDNKAICHQ